MYVRSHNAAELRQARDTSRRTDFDASPGEASTPAEVEHLPWQHRVIALQLLLRHGQLLSALLACSMGASVANLENAQLTLPGSQISYETKALQSNISRCALAVVHMPNIVQTQAQPGPPM